MWLKILSFKIGEMVTGSHLFIYRVIVFYSHSEGRSSGKRTNKLVLMAGFGFRYSIPLELYVS